jgi:hypothetical protein
MGDISMSDNANLTVLTLAKSTIKSLSKCLWDYLFSHPA